MANKWAGVNEVIRASGNDIRLRRFLMRGKGDWDKKFEIAQNYHNIFYGLKLLEREHRKRESCCTLYHSKEIRKRLESASVLL